MQRCKSDHSNACGKIFRPFTYTGFEVEKGGVGDDASFQLSANCFLLLNLSSTKLRLSDLRLNIKSI